MPAGLRSAAPAPEELANHLARLDRDAVVALVGLLRDDGATVDDIITGLLGPALVEVGRRWAVGETGSAEAQAAAAIVRTALPRSALPEGPAGHRPVAVCSPHREHHELPGEMFTELLRAEGWPAHHIGAGVTAQQLPRFLASQRPLALLVSCTTPCGLPGAARAIQTAHGLGVPVLVGGAAFGSDSLVAVRLGAAAWAQTARHAIDVLEAWNSAPPVILPGRALSDDYLRFERNWTDIKADAGEAFRRATPADHTDPAGLHAAHDRLELLLRYLGASLLVDDGRVFHDFLSWRSAYYCARGISPERLVAGLTAIATALPPSAERAASFVGDGLQHLAWTSLSNGGARTTSVAGAPQGSVAAGIVGASGGIPGVATGGAPGAGSGPSSAAAAAPGLLQAIAEDQPVPAPAAPSGDRDTAGGGGGSRPAGSGARQPGQPAPGTGSQSSPVKARPVGHPEGADQPGRVFADLLVVAAMTCRSPLALISVARPDGRWSTLSHGTDRRDLLVDDELFAAIGQGGDPLEITDLAADAVWRGSALAVGPLGIRHVYGIPLRDRQSALLGVICVLDRRPRELSSRERQAMTAIARQVRGQLAAWRRGTGANQPVRSDFEGAHAAVASRPDGRLTARGGPDPELLRSHEVAVLFDVTERTVINWASAQRLPSIRTAGGHLRFRADDVLTLLAGRGGDSRRLGPLGALGA